MSVLRNLEEEAYKFYDMANKSFNTALLARCNAQHFLSPYIDSEFNHNAILEALPGVWGNRGNGHKFQGTRGTKANFEENRETKTILGNREQKKIWGNRGTSQFI